MRRFVRLVVQAVVGPALVGACVSSGFVDLGTNVDASNGMREAASPLDAAAEAPLSIAADSASEALASNAEDSAADSPPLIVEDSPGEASSGLCPRNPMFTGTPNDGGIPPGNAPSPLLPDWQVCGGRVDVNPGACSLPPPQMSTTYLGLPQFPVVQSLASVSTLLPAMLPPGAYPFSIDLGLAVSTWRGGFALPGTTPVVLKIYGSTSPCGRDDLLWTSNQIANIDSWSTNQGVLMASRAFSNLVLVPSLTTLPVGPSAGAYVIVGNFVSQSCN